MRTIYFDNSATTPVKEEVLCEMYPYFKAEYGNASSIYSLGRKSRKAIEESRKKVAKLINCEAEEIIFTSCGTESDNTALKGIAYLNKNKGNHIITSKIEHPAILKSCENLKNKGFEITYLDVDKNGRVNLESLRKSIKKETILISIMYANNEIGAIQPINEIAEIAHNNNIIFHTDAVQAVGNINIDVKEQKIDMLSLSGHKIYAPKGIGALYVRDGIGFERFMDGGHQENDRRAGTENVAQIVGLGKACEIAQRELPHYIEKLRDIRNYCLEKLEQEIGGIYINGGMEDRLPGNINISFKNINSAELLLRLDEYGICASGGSACSSSETKASHVLQAIGTPDDLIKNAIRFSFGNFNSRDEIDYLIKVLKKIID